MLSETACPDKLGKSRLSATKAGFAGKISIFLAFIFAGILATGCTTTYLNLNENNRDQIENEIYEYEQDKNEGAEVTLSLQNGKEINGELLSVRDSTMIICTEHSAKEEELTSLKYPINTVRNDEIKELTIEGSNYVLAGLGIGIAVVTVIGYLVGKGGVTGAVGSSAAVPLGTGGGFLLGAIVGPLIGWAASTEEYILQEIPLGYDMTFLKPLARYPDEEPEYLRAIE